MCDIILGWLKEWQFWMVLASIVGGIFAARKYFDSKKQQEFDNYHKLIERINRSLNSDEPISLQVQQAAIFELRYYKRYKELTEKLLEYWKSKDNYKDFVVETLSYLENYKRTKK